GRRAEPAGDVPRAGSRARVDDARGSRDRQRPGGDRRRRARRRRNPRAPAGAGEGRRVSAVAYARERARVAVSADVASLAALGVCAAVGVALTWKTWGDLNGDTGHDFVAGSRFAH